MSLSQRKIPILPTVNDTPSVNGQSHHPNSALFCKNYNDLIDYELNGLSDSINLLSQGISNLSANIQGIDTEIQNQSINIGVLESDLSNLNASAENYQQVFNSINTSITNLQNAIPVSYVQQANQIISNAVAYTLTGSFVYNSGVLDNLNILYPFTFKKRTRVKGYTYAVTVAFPVNNAFELQIYRSDSFGNPSTPIRNIVPNFWSNSLSPVGTYDKDIAELENIVFEKDETIWFLFRVHKVGTGTLTGGLRTLLVGGLPPLPNTLNNSSTISYSVISTFDMNLPNPLSQASFVGGATVYPYIPLRTIAV